MTIDELYEAFMDEGKWGEGGEFGPKSFAEDIFDFFDFELGEKGWTPEDWGAEYGMYLPVWDPAGIALAERERDIDYEKALDTLDLTKKATDRVYTTELDTLSTQLGREMQKGKAVAGGLGLRSGTLESAVEDTITQAGTKTKDFGDRLMISEKEMLDKYNMTMVDTALDFKKTKRQEKEDFYNRTMAAITKLGGEGAFDCKNEGEVWCDRLSVCTSPDDCLDCAGGTPITCPDSGQCVNHECDCPEMADNPICISQQGEGNQMQDCSAGGSLCGGVPGTVGGMSCSQMCVGTLTGEFDPHVFTQQADSEMDAQCPEGWDWNTSTGNRECIGGGGQECDYPDVWRDGCCRDYSSGQCV